MKMTIWYVATNYNKDYLTYESGGYRSYAEAYAQIKRLQEYSNDKYVVVQSDVEVY
jgi:hypothetical protein